jgi:hypothetical protein
MFTVAILGIATVASAWCAFQSSRWNDVSDDEARTATDLRVEQSRLYSQGTQIGLYDTQIVTAYASAVADKNEALQTFLHDSLMRPALVPIVDDCAPPCSWPARCSSPGWSRRSRLAAPKECSCWERCCCWPSALPRSSTSPSPDPPVT